MSEKLVIKEITEFSPDLATMPKPGRKVLVRIFCQICYKHHQLHWGEFQNALSTKPRKSHNIGYGRAYPTSLQEILGFYAWKYCGGSHAGRQTGDRERRGADGRS